MKKILLLFTLFTLFSCTSDNEVRDNANVSPMTRSLEESSNYYFDFYNNESTYKFDFLGNIRSDLPYILSYSTTSDGYNNIWLELVSKPEWVDTVMIATVYEKIFIAMPQLKNNNSTEERSGGITLRQKDSNKILYYNVVQESSSNKVSIGVNKTYKNQYEFTATTTYPVKGEVRVRVPLVVYNDGGELTHEALIVIAKGQTTGSYLMDWNASPLVYYHGDLKGYRLYEGSFTGDNIYTYSFVRYW